MRRTMMLKSMRNVQRDGACERCCSMDLDPWHNASIHRLLIRSMWAGMFVCVWLLGTVDPVHAASPSERLLKVISGNNEPMRMQAIGTFCNDPAATEAQLDKLISMVQVEAEKLEELQQIRPSSVALVELIGSIKNETCETFLCELMEAKNRWLVMTAADTLGKNQYVTAVPQIEELSHRAAFLESYGFRFAVIRALTLMDDPSAYRIIKQLAPKLDGQLRYHVNKTLAGLKPEQLGPDPDKPAADKAVGDVAKADETAIELTSGNSDYDGSERMRLAKTQYYGIDLHCKRMLFILDVSGSMTEAEYGVSRLDRAKQELINTIQQLPEDSEFGVMIFSNSVACWRNELLKATVPNKRDAIQYVYKLAPGSHTNTSGALQAAMDFDPNLESIYLLTDGRPTMGPLVAPPQIIADVVCRNRFRHLNINTIGFALDAQTVQFMQQLAELGAGEFKAVF